MNSCRLKHYNYKPQDGFGDNLQNDFLTYNVKFGQQSFTMGSLSQTVSLLRVK